MFRRRQRTHTWMAMSLPGGNAIQSWRKRDTAEAWIRIVLKNDPDMEDAMVVVGFDRQGMPTETLYEPPK